MRVDGRRASTFPFADPYLKVLRSLSPSSQLRGGGGPANRLLGTGGSRDRNLASSSTVVGLVLGPCVRRKWSIFSLTEAGAEVSGADVDVDGLFLIVREG